MTRARAVRKGAQHKARRPASKASGGGKQAEIRNLKTHCSILNAEQGLNVIMPINPSLGGPTIKHLQTQPFKHAT